MANGQQAQTVQTPQDPYSQYGGNVAVDPYSAYGGNSSPAIPDTDAYWNTLKDKYGLPHSVDLSKDLIGNFFTNIPSEDYNKIDPVKFAAAYKEANPGAPPPTGYFGRAWDEVKGISGGLLGGGFLTAPLVNGPGPMASSDVAGSPTVNPMETSEAVKQRLAEAKEHPLAAAGAATADLGAAALPLLVDQAPEFIAGENPSASIESALTSKLSLEEANTPHPGGKIQPALNNTPAEVLNHVSEKGGSLLLARRQIRHSRRTFKKPERMPLLVAKI